MAGGWTATGAALAQNRTLRNTGTAPTTLYVGLATVAVGATDTLSTITEVTTAGYSRQAVTFSAPSGTSPSAISNTAEITFGPFTADPPAVAYAFLTDAASGTAGSIYYRWTGTSVDAGLNESLRIAASSLVINEVTTSA